MFPSREVSRGANSGQQSPSFTAPAAGFLKTSSPLDKLERKVLFYYYSRLLHVGLRCCVFEFCFLVARLPPKHTYPLCSSCSYIWTPVSRLMGFHSRCPLHLPLPPTAQQWLRPFFLNAPYVLNSVSHRRLSARCPLKGQTHYITPTSEPPSATFIDGAASQPLALLPVLKKWKQKNATLLQTTRISDYFGHWTVSAVLAPQHTHIVCLTAVVLPLLQWCISLTRVACTEKKTKSCRNTQFLFHIPWHLRD